MYYKFALQKGLISYGKEEQAMRQKQVGLMVFVVLVSILLTCGLSWAQSPPTLLVVVRASDDTLWKMTCDEVACSPFEWFLGLFRYQPTVTWDETAQEWVLVGTASDNTIWMSTFDKQGNFNNDWQQVPGLTPSPAGVAGGTPKGVTRTVNCPGQSLQAAVDAARPGDIINVTGVCNENVSIGTGKHSLTLDGQNAATINGPNSGIPTLTVRGTNILIRNFEITGGVVGIDIERGSTAVIDHNNIHNTVNHGIYIAESAFGVIKNNNIHNNPADGVHVAENSSARIGYELNSDTSASPNTILNNGGRGITINRSSNARIAGNTISGNTSDGIVVARASQADIAGNIINSNSGNGILVSQNSGIELGEDNPVKFWDQPNTTTSNNLQYGIACTLGGYVRGHLGSSNQINGTAGQTDIATSCPYTLLTP